MLHATHVLAATPFWDTDIGNLVGTLLGAVGIILTLIVLAGAVKSVAAGRAAEAAKRIAVAVLVAALFLNPKLLTNMAGALGGVWEAVANSIGQIIG